MNATTAPPTLLKAHWNCHGICSCSCRFCYGMFVGHPALDEADGRRLIDRVAAGGVIDFVLGGGDPFQRKDLVRLVEHAVGSRLHVEIQTNVQVPASPALLETLEPLVTRWGLSLDSADPVIHERVRGRVGNHAKVTRAGEWLTSSGAEWNLRTLLSKPTIDSVAEIGEWLSKIRFPGKWYLLEYSPTGDERAHRTDFEIPTDLFHERAQAIVERYSGRSFRVLPVPDEDRRGIYCLMAPDGSVYNHPPPGADYTVVGNVLDASWEELVRGLVIDYEGHEARYGDSAIREAIEGE